MAVKWDRTRGVAEPIAALNRIEERENHEPLVDLRIVAPELPLIRETVLPFLRQQVIEKLKIAAAKLPDGVRLSVVDAWRPISRQKRIFDFFYKNAQEAFPGRDHAALRRTVCRWAAPADQPAPPGHCTGGAVDVFLTRPDGEIIDVSAPFERFEAAPTFAYGLTDQAEKFRMLLYEAMVSTGFSNCRDEWWHYSYGDAGWAVRTGAKTCFYGLVELTEMDYSAQEIEHAKAMSERPNPFLPSESST